MTCMTLRLLVPLFYLLSVTAASNPTSSPIIALLPRHLVAFYPLLSDSRDYAPDGTPSGYSQDALPRSTKIPTSPTLGARLEQGSGINFPIDIHSRNFPQLTVGAWVQTAAVNSGCLLSQNGSSVGRALCVDRGRWEVGDQVVEKATVVADEWSFVAVVFSEESATVFVDGEMIDVGLVVQSIASPLLVVGAAVERPLDGFQGYLKSVFAFDTALTETELSYLMTTEEIVIRDTGDDSTTVTTPVAEVEKTEVIPHFYLKDQLENTVSMRQAIDPDADEYNVALPTVDDNELLSVELVYADNIFNSEASTVGKTVTPELTIWSIEPENREVHIGSLVTVQGSPNFDSRFSMCRINGNIDDLPDGIRAGRTSNRRNQR
ncbi:uncharacterized protein KRP23_9917 [Phytophthora ramorum]|uniref:uncharacterized protein n=1 Tax=Phytophthora ramorum TaxID=164328 RepID=UPI00309C000B|nr:hypothetical protein KRP23_9917 [Phytophthora ramorum]